MCEFVVRLIDRYSEDPIANEQLSKRGDIIDLQDDGFDWGTDVVESKDWAIVKLPKVDKALYVGAVSPELDNKGDLARRRAFKFAFDKDPEVKDKVRHDVAYEVEDKDHDKIATLIERKPTLGVRLR